MDWMMMAREQTKLQSEEAGETGQEHSRETAARVNAVGGRCGKWDTEAYGRKKKDTRREQCTQTNAPERWKVTSVSFI